MSHKTDEFLISFSHNSPRVLWLTEHQLRAEEIKNVNFGQHTLWAHFCRQTYKQGGAIYVSNDIQYNTVNLDQYNREKDLEICALKIRVLSNSLIVICIYRSPTGNFTYFLNQLEFILNKIYSVSTNLILCGDFNTNHLDVNSRKYLLESLLASFSLFSSVKIPTRIFNNSSTLTDNIYIDINRLNFSVHPLVNGLSDHDVQVINLSNIFWSVPKHLFSFTRRIDNNSVRKCADLLNEIWEDVLQENVNIIFNNSLNTYLRTFYVSFPIKKI
jgi:exonuclease III